jgi:hypothetical protein
MPARRPGALPATRKAAPAKPQGAGPAAAQPAPRVPVGVRPAGSLSRLTVKPGPGPLARDPLVPSTRPRPSGPRPLSDVELDEDEVLIDAFDAALDGVKVRITAVLERTCVYIDRGGDRQLASKKELWVEADKLPIRRRGIG